MNKPQIAKKIAVYTVGYSASFTTARLITANAPVNKFHHKVAVGVTAFVAGWYVSDKLEKFTEEQIDNVITALADLSTTTSN